ncbi:cupin domain-containing protein [Paraburkholderia phytofirmans]|uniref:Uncharacterized protein n=1 Tax=Paraburkholderia phytofirmans (strain DSM 17436 / LMG 22146 / PsJN) TaxID=398527 RepID=B2T426_PARPJ|nr:hypothetical protein [Paraburkholderia phytofirmans]ACD16337.1 hypothetical protein Bphyt_1929 [Paraburkholderia phytofirmans PsJN]
MSACQSRIGSARGTAARLTAGQMAVHDLRARTSIVAVEGDLQLEFRDHSLAWLGDAVPVTSITLREGECFVTPQRGVVSISAAQANAAAFVLQPWHVRKDGRGPIREALRHLASLVKTRLRRAV